ncbi:MAG: helix-turn-helix domain-containing protein [Planctomycetota bacterium]
MKQAVLTALLVDCSRARKPDDELLSQLRARGFQTKTARDPRRAAAVVAKGGVQIVLLLLGKRSQAVDEILPRFRAVNADVPVLALTEQRTLEESLQVLRGGAADYLDRRQLDGRLDETLNRIIAEKGFTPSLEHRLIATVGERLAAARRSKRLTLRQLGTRTDLSPSLLSQIERARTNPSVATLLKLTRALHLRLDELFLGF